MHRRRSLPALRQAAHAAIPAVATLATMAAVAVLAPPATAVAVPTVSAFDGDDDTRARRQLYGEVYAEAREGNWAPAEAAERELRDYPLWPDLRSAWLQATLRHADAAAVEAFLQEHGELPPARRLADRWIHELARRGDWPR